MLERLLALPAFLAQTTAPVVTGTGTGTTPPAGPLPWWAQIIEKGGMLIPLSIILIVFYVVVFRQKQKQDKNKKDLLENIKKGDRIETIGGLLGSVVSSDANTVTLKVDETANVKLTFNRRAIHRVIVEDEKK